MCQFVKRKALVFESNSAMADLIRFYLEESGFDVLTLSEGQNFIEKIASYKPDLITMKTSLPDAGGRELLNTLIGDTRTSQIPIVVIGTNELKADHFDSKVLVFLEEPFTEKKLKETIHVCLERVAE